MTNLSGEQEELRASIKKGAIIWGVVLGLIVAGLAYWILGDQGAVIRSGASAILGLVVASAMYRKSLSSGAAGAKCPECDAAFSISRTERQEVLVKSKDRETRKELDNGDTEITTWVEEVYDVDDTYSCSSCSDTSHKKYQSSRKRDEKVVVKSAGKREKGADAGKQRSASSAKPSGKNSR
ncbi:MAG: hypothetical protein KAT26_04890 [Marinosulfonomonas sp.]|nr:hypothetical protein [Marinosulfonomonas sp.]